MSTTTTAQPTFRADRYRDAYEANLPVPSANFVMDSWCDIRPCGTVACFCGNYAAAHPELGFVLDPEQTLIRDGRGVSMTRTQWAEHFGITEDEAYDLFVSGNTPNDKAGALARLRAFAAERGLELPEYQGEGAGT